jgi:hypothetical protein
MPVFALLLAGSAFLVLAYGSKSGWRTQAQYAQGDAAAPPVQGEDIVGGALKRWFFWYILPFGATQYGARGPSYMTDQEAFDLEANTKAGSLGAQLFRFVWIPAKGVWVYDRRNEPSLLASREIRDDQGNVVGAIALSKPMVGKWPYETLPKEVTIDGKLFKKARLSVQKTGVVGQYREDVPTNSVHLYVLYDGTYLATHVDEANPDMGRAIEHLLKDVIKPMRVA